MPQVTLGSVPTLGGGASCVGQARVAPAAFSSVIIETPRLFWAPATKLWMTIGIRKQPRSLGNPCLGVHTGITKPVLSKWLEK